MVKSMCAKIIIFAGIIEAGGEGAKGPSLIGLRYIT